MKKIDTNYIIKVNKDGRITMPAGLRAELKAKPGDRFTFEVQDKNLFIITKALESKHS